MSDDTVLPMGRKPLRRRQPGLGGQYFYMNRTAEEIEILRKEHSARIKMALARRRAEGLPMGRPQSLNAKEILRLRSNGMSIGDIAKELDCSKGGVNKVLRRYKDKI